MGHEGGRDSTEDFGTVGIGDRSGRNLWRSPYRNYVNRELPETEEVVYFMLLYPEPVIERFYKILQEEGITEELKVVKNRWKERERYSSLPGQYDIVIEAGDSNKAVHMLKKLYEPYKLPFQGKDKNYC